MKYDVRRRPYIVIAGICLGLCVAIVLVFSPYPFIRGFLGDCLIVVLLYCLIKAVRAFTPKRLAIGVLLFAFAIEGLQYLKLVHLLGLSGNKLAQLTLGSVFDPLDLLAYTLGAGIAYAIDVFAIDNRH
ncbi:MAG: DUF2809 domain-containing protein [Spirochaetia bacterium]|nr:DUF2809 domain-containing protein [Spirochaetia bacterium]